MIILHFHLRSRLDNNSWIFQQIACCEKYLKDNKHSNHHFAQAYARIFVLNLDIICSLKLAVFLELRSKKTVRLWEQIMPTNKYPRIFLRQIEAIVNVLMVKVSKERANTRNVSFITCYGGQFTFST